MNSRLRGRNAAHSGQQGEANFEGLLHASGFEVMEASEMGGLFSPNKAAYRQVPVTHPFKPKEYRRGRNDFLLVAGGETVYVQVKNQNSGGTTDEKIAFTFDYAAYGIDELKFTQFWIVLLGMFWNKDHQAYLDRKCREFEWLNERVQRNVKGVALLGMKQSAIAIRKL